MRASSLSPLLLGSIVAACSGSNSSSPGGGQSNPDGGSKVVTGTDGGTTVAPDGAVVVSGPVPTIGGCQVFPADNPWNTRIDDTTKFPVNAMASTYAASMAPSTRVHPDWGDWSTDHYGIPWQVVPASQALVPITFNSSADESDPGPYPFPASALVEGGAGSGGDQHVLVLQSGSCELFETYNSAYTNPGWSCDSAAKWSLGSNTLRTDGYTSADAAGLPILPGLVKVSEVNAGAITHAIRFTMNSTQQGYIHPATHAAGKADTSLPPMGLRLRIKAGFDTSKFTGPSLVVVTAMMQYGVILADNGSNWYISGDSDDAWTNLMDDLVTQLGNVHGSDFEAVDSGPISTAGL